MSKTDNTLTNNQTKGNNMTTVFTYTADQAVQDGLFTDITQLAKETKRLNVSDLIVRLSVGIKEQTNSDSFEFHVNMILKALFDAWDKDTSVFHPEGDGLIQFTYKPFGKIWAMLDFTSGQAIHIFFPSEY